MKGLGVIIHKHIRGSDFIPYFYLQENYGTREERPSKIFIEQGCIDAMYQRGVFELPGNPIRVHSTSRASVTRISLRLQTESYVPPGTNRGYRQNAAPEERFLPISGFPRVLYQNHEVASPSPSMSSNSKEPRDEEFEPPQPPHRAQTEHSTPGLRSKLSMAFSRTVKLDQGHMLSRWSGAGSVRRGSQTTLNSVTEPNPEDEMTLKFQGRKEDFKVADGTRKDD